MRLYSLPDWIRNRKSRLWPQGAGSHAEHRVPASEWQRGHRMGRPEQTTGEHSLPGTRCSVGDKADLTYGDALLDERLRKYFQEEYGAVEPPEGIFPKLLEAIRRHREMTASSNYLNARSTRHVLERLACATRLMAGPIVARLTTGGVALALMALILAASLHSRETPTLQEYDLTILSVPTSVSTAVTAWPQERGTELDSHDSFEALAYDPAELQRPTTGGWRGDSTDRTQEKQELRKRGNEF
jgi:hypothetical protein